MREIDYTTYPDAVAPRRFEIINTAKGENAVYAHGVMFYNGQVVIAHPGTESVQVFGRMALEDLALRHQIRWLDPPFQQSEEKH